MLKYHIDCLLGTRESAHRPPTSMGCTGTFENQIAKTVYGRNKSEKQDFETQISGLIRIAAPMQSVNACQAVRAYLEASQQFQSRSSANTLEGGSVPNAP
jgi:hypothetical protein